MTKRIYILCEGKTEQEFVNQILSEYFYQLGINDVRGIIAETSKGHKGGSLSYERYKHNIQNLLKIEKGVIISSLIDFYKLSTDFPNYANIMKISNKITQVTQLEEAIQKDISNERFIPYIQLHEFEALLFSSLDGFENIPNLSGKNKKKIKTIIEQYDNPELINEGDNTHPSKRLQLLIPCYRKPLHSIQIIKQTGLEVIAFRCKRFAEWLKKLNEKVKN